MSRRTIAGKTVPIFNEKQFCINFQALGFQALSDNFRCYFDVISHNKQTGGLTVRKTFSPFFFFVYSK